MGCPQLTGPGDADLGSMTPSPLDLLRFLLIPRSTESRAASHRTRQLQTPVTPAAPRKRLPVTPQHPGPASRVPPLPFHPRGPIGVPALAAAGWLSGPERPPSEGGQGGVQGPDLGPGNFFCFSVSLYFSHCLPVSLSLSDRLSVSLSLCAVSVLPLSLSVSYFSPSVSASVSHCPSHR